MSKHETPVFVVGAVASARTRHTDNRQKVTVTIPRTQLNCECWGKGLARNKVNDELRELGFNSWCYVLEWIYE